MTGWPASASAWARGRLGGCADADWAGDPARRVRSGLAVPRGAHNYRERDARTGVSRRRGGDRGRDPLVPGADLAAPLRSARARERPESTGAPPHPRRRHALGVPAARRRTPTSPRDPLSASRRGGTSGEIVVGTVVIAPPGARRPRTAEEFQRPCGPGYAKAVMNFRIEDAGRGCCVVRTETRVHATDARTRRRFAAYWWVIYPGSALIRRMWLRAIRRRAEATPPPPPPPPPTPPGGTRGGRAHTP